MMESHSVESHSVETHSPDESISGRFVLAIVLTAITLAAEVVGGFWTHSLALLSDAAHVFLDLFALLLSLGAIKLAALPVTETRTYGWHRTEVFASFINGATIFLIAAGIFYEAWGRFLTPTVVDSLPMFLIAFVGLVMNLLAASVLHRHTHDDLNVRSAFLHVLGDAAASVGVIIGGVIMFYTNWFVLDAIISMGIGFIVFLGALRILRDSIHILLEGVPRGLAISEIADSIRSIQGVNDIHHLNVWALCSHIVALSAHVRIDDAHKKQQAEIVHEIEDMLLDRFRISHTTLQVECLECAEEPVLKKLGHGLHPAHGHHRHRHKHG